MYNCHMKNDASFTVFWSGDEVDLFDNVVGNNIIDCDECTSKPLKDMWGGGNLCDCIMVNNVFRNGGGSGLCVIRTPKRLICASNSVHNGVVAGISMETGIETVIANNVVRDCGGGGIKIPASTHGEGNGCLIVGNVSRDNADRGINAVGDNHIISNNFVYANNLVGIEVSGSNCIVSGNIIKIMVEIPQHLQHFVEVSGLQML